MKNGPRLRAIDAEGMGGAKKYDLLVASYICGYGISGRSFAVDEGRRRNLHDEFRRHLTLAVSCNATCHAGYKPR